MRKLIENITRIRSAAGMEIILQADGSLSICTITLHRKGSEVSVAEHHEHLANIEDALRLLPKKIPLVLVIHGKGILSKTVSCSETDTSLSLLSKVLPNANAGEFNLQCSVSGSEASVSVIRSSVLENLLSPFTKDHHPMAEAYLGTLPIPDLIQEKNLSHNAMAAALTLFTASPKGIENSGVLHFLKEEYRERGKFERRGWTSLAACFLILLINYMIFDHYWSKNNDINVTLATGQNALLKYETLKKEVDQKKSFLEQNGLLENSRTSFYADRLAVLLPSDIRWQEMDIHPLKKKSPGNEAELISFEKERISIAGLSHKSTALNDWIQSLKKLEWVQNVQLVDYKQDHAKEDGMFRIEIELK